MLELVDLRDFSISNWYKKFDNIAIKTALLEIPVEVVRNLTSDNPTKDVCPNEFITRLRDIVSTFNNKCFVKNNWHAPMDAKVFSFGNELKVINIDDLFLYLSTSTIIARDFTTEHNIPFFIALKPWLDIHPASEFRCIVVNNILRGITPRDWPTYYAHFKDDAPTIVETITNFFKENVLLRFPRKSYTFDIILSYPDGPQIVDFGPLTSKTTLYAFSWTEIAALLNQDVPEEVAAVFRYLESDIGIMTKADAIYKFATAVTGEK